MALINCEECGREISDRAHACPGCGVPVAAAAPAPAAPAPAGSSKVECVRCGLSDRTLQIGSVLLREQSFSASDGVQQLDGTITTVQHGRFQQAFGAGWIQATRGFREGSVSSVNLAGSFQSQGVQTGALGAAWLGSLPQDDGSSRYQETLERLGRSLYCERCDVVSEDGEVRSFHEAVVSEFGAQHLSSLTAWAEQVDLILQSASAFDMRWPFATAGENTERIATRFATAVSKLEAAGYGAARHLGGFEMGADWGLAAFQFGSAAKVAVLGALGGKKHLPGMLLLSAIPSLDGEGQGDLSLTGAFWINGLTDFGMKHWFTFHEERLSAATGLTVNIL